MLCLMAKQYDTTSKVMLDGFQASYVSSYTEELWYNETVCLYMTIYIYIYIYILHGFFLSSLQVILVNTATKYVS